MKELLRYSVDDYDFSRFVEQALDVSPLSSLHKIINVPQARQSDQDSLAHNAFYGHFEELVAATYYEFVRNEIVPLFGEAICLQRVPTFRVSFPGSTAVNSYHRDSEFYHQPGTRNFWVPLTKAFETNSIWIETEAGSEQYHPMNLEVGEMLMFNAIKLRHGNQPNDTGKTRASFDFRVIPYREFQSSETRTVTEGIPLCLGHYYALMSKDGSLSFSSTGYGDVS